MQCCAQARVETDTEKSPHTAAVCSKRKQWIFFNLLLVRSKRTDNSKYEGARGAGVKMGLNKMSRLLKFRTPHCSVEVAFTKSLSFPMSQLRFLSGSSQPRLAELPWRPQKSTNTNISEKNTMLYQYGLLLVVSLFLSVL